MDKKVKTGVVTAVVAAGMLTNAAADDPAELLNPSDTQDDSHISVISSEDMPDYAVYLDELEELHGMDRFRDWILRMPLGVRAAVMLPLWAVGEVGFALLSAASAAFSTVAGKFILGLLLQCAILFAVFAVAYKAVFPKTPIKELLGKKKFPWIWGGALIVTIADLAFRQVWPEWGMLRLILMVAVGFLTLMLLWSRLCSHLPGPERKRKRLDYVCQY